MALQMLSSTERFFALSTFVQLLSAVNQEVISQSSSFTEELFSFRTDVQFLSTVNQEVLSHSFSSAELFCALSACV